MTMELAFPLVLLFGLALLAPGSSRELALEVPLHEGAVLVEVLHEETVIRHGPSMSFSKMPLFL